MELGLCVQAVSLNVERSSLADVDRPMDWIQQYGTSILAAVSLLQTCRGMLSNSSATLKYNADRSAYATRVQGCSVSEEPRRGSGLAPSARSRAVCEEQRTMNCSGKNGLTMNSFAATPASATRAAVTSAVVASLLPPLNSATTAWRRVDSAASMASSRWMKQVASRGWESGCPGGSS